MRYRVSLKKNWLCYLACGLMLLSAALRLWHFIPRWGDTDWFTLVTQLFVPLLANGVFCYGALKKGGYLITVLSVFLGVLFFIIKAQGFAHAWHTICVPCCICWCSSFTPSPPWGWCPASCPKSWCLPCPWPSISPRTCSSPNPPSWPRPSRNSPCCASWAPCWPLPSPSNRIL